MNEADYLRKRAETCCRLARSMTVTTAVRQLEAQAAEFARQAAALDARLASRK